MNNDADALLALRQAIKAKTTITYAQNGEPCQNLLDATHLVVSPTCSLQKSAPTRYRKSGVAAGAGSDDFFSVEAIYLAWLLQSAPGADYMKQARENGLAVGFVSVTERKNVVGWLEGKISENDRIVPLVAESTTPPGTPPSGSKVLPATPHRSTTAAQASPSKRRYVADSRDVQVVKKIKQNEIELRDRNSVLRGTKPNNFSNIRSVYSDKLKKLKESRSGATPSAAGSATPNAKRAQKHSDPIIMISSSPTALITMHNVKQFLEESTFIPSQAARQSNTRTEDVLHIIRKRTSIDPSGREHESRTRYFVVDAVEALGKFGPDAWERVVCVMTTGQAWQFRPYKWNEPIQLFHHVKGIYVSWSNDPPNAKIKDWNVTELKIDPLRRHVDKSVVAQFWKTLDTWTTANKPWLIKR